MHGPVFLNGLKNSPHTCPLSDYGKNRKYLKPTAIPTRHLNLNNESKDLVQFNDSDVIKKLLLDIPEVIECRGEACQQLFLTAKSLQTYNQRLISHIKSLEKRIDYLEEQTKKSTSTKFADAANDADFMLGPTQTRCLLNKVIFFYNTCHRVHANGNCMLLPKLFLPTLRKNCSSYRENYFEIRGWLKAENLQNF